MTDFTSLPHEVQQLLLLLRDRFADQPRGSQDAALYEYIVTVIGAAAGVRPTATLVGALTRERAYQDAKWGSLSEHPHEVGGWLTLLRTHLRDAEDLWAGRPGDEAALFGILKVVAIGAACLEAHGIVERDFAAAYAKLEAQRLRAQINTPADITRGLRGRFADAGWARFVDALDAFYTRAWSCEGSATSVADIGINAMADAVRLLPDAHRIAFTAYLHARLATHQQLGDLRIERSANGPLHVMARSGLALAEFHVALAGVDDPMSLVAQAPAPTTDAA